MNKDVEDGEEFDNQDELSPEIIIGPSGNAMTVDPIVYEPVQLDEPSSNLVD